MIPEVLYNTNMFVDGRRRAGSRADVCQYLCNGSDLRLDSGRGGGGYQQCQLCGHQRRSEKGRDGFG